MTGTVRLNAPPNAQTRRRLAIGEMHAISTVLRDLNATSIDLGQQREVFLVRMSRLTRQQ